MSVDTKEPKSEETIIFDVREWKTKIEKTKRKGRVRVSFKLDKNESAGFESFCKTVMPKGCTQEEFVKLIFFNGVEALNKEFAQIAQDYAEQQAATLSLEGINPEETIEAATEVLNPSSTP